MVLGKKRNKLIGVCVCVPVRNLDWPHQYYFCCKFILRRLSPPNSIRRKTTDNDPNSCTSGLNRRQYQQRKGTHLQVLTATSLVGKIATNRGFYSYYKHFGARPSIQGADKNNAVSQKEPLFISKNFVARFLAARQRGSLNPPPNHVATVFGQLARTMHL